MITPVSRGAGGVSRLRGGGVELAATGTSAPALSDTGSTRVVRDIVAVELAVPDPAGYAQRWATLLDLPGSTTGLDLGGRRLRFVPRAEGRAGLVAVELAGSARAGHVLCGVRCSIVPAA